MRNEEDSRPSDLNRAYREAMQRLDRKEILANVLTFFWCIASIAAGIAVGPTATAAALAAFGFAMVGGILRATYGVGLKNERLFVQLLAGGGNRQSPQNLKMENMYKPAEPALKNTEVAKPVEAVKPVEEKMTTPVKETVKVSPEGLKTAFEANATPDDLRIILKAMELILEQKGIKVEEPAPPAPPVFGWQECRDFTKAIEKGDLATVTRFVDTFGTAADVKDHYGFTTLMHAIAWQQKAVIELLLDKGYAVDERSRKTKGTVGNATVLMSAAGRGEQEIAELLIKKGADVNAADNDGETAMSRAQSRNDGKMVSLLVNSGAAMDMQDKNGNTALIRAIAKGDKASVELMLKTINANDPMAKGDVVNLRNAKGQNALMAAVEKVDTDLIVSLLRSNATMDVNDIEALKPKYTGLADLIQNWPKIREKMNEDKITELKKELKKVTDRAEKAEKGLHVAQTRLAAVADKVEKTIGRQSDMDIIDCW